MTIPTLPLGGTGADITRLGFGAWAIGGGGWRFGWGSQREDESIEAIRAAVERGVGWIDTAPVYGRGTSEEVVGRAIADIPADERPLVFTKCGLRFDPDDPSAGPDNVLAPESIRWELEASLRRLGVERIDLYQVHWPPTDGTPLEEYWGVLHELKREGLVAAVGLSNHGLDELERAEKVGHVDTLQPPFSLLHRDAAADLLPWCAEHGTATLVYSPMQSGLLTGAMSTARVAALPDDDWRRSDPDFVQPALDRNLAVAAALGPIARRHDTTPGAVAVAWTLAQPGVTAAIVGARRADQVGGWADAASVALDEDDLEALADAVRTAGAGSGPV